MTTHHVRRQHASELLASVVPISDVRDQLGHRTQSPDHFYSALTVEVRPAPFEGEEPGLVFEEKGAYPGGAAFGMLTLDGTETLYALDGQHRLKSIELAIRQKPKLAREHIVVVLVPFRAMVRSQTLFSDLLIFAWDAKGSGMCGARR